MNIPCDNRSVDEWLAWKSSWCWIEQVCLGGGNVKHVEKLVIMTQNLQPYNYYRINVTQNASVFNVFTF